MFRLPSTNPLCHRLNPDDLLPPPGSLAFVRYFKSGGVKIQHRFSHKMFCEFAPHGDERALSDESRVADNKKPRGSLEGEDYKLSQ